MAGVRCDTKQQAMSRRIPDSVTLSPPLIDGQAYPPPGLWSAAALIALYFLLQAAGSGAIAVVMGLVTGYVGFGAAARPLGEALRTMLAQPGMPAILLMLTLALAAVLLVPLVRRRYPQLWARRMPPGFGIVMPENRIFFALGVILGLAAPVVGGVLTYLLAHGNPVTQDIQTLGAHTPIALRVLLVTAVIGLGPLVEELLFRGVLLSALLGRLPVGWSVVISALLFSIVHLPSMQWQWYALPDLALLALGLAWLRLRSGSLWPAILAHGVNNLLAVMVWFVAASPT